MKAYKKTVTLKSTGKLTLTGLPFKAGDRLDVIVLAEEKKTENVKVIKASVQGNQEESSGSAEITEEEIYSEIKKYRSGKMKVVVDTNVVVSAIIRDRLPEKILVCDREQSRPRVDRFRENTQRIRESAFAAKIRIAGHPGKMVRDF